MQFFSPGRKSNSYTQTAMHILKKTTAFLFICVLILPGTYLISGCSMSYNGEKLFFREGCSQCHTYKGRGGRMGPDLSAVTNLHSDSWIERYLQNPKDINPFARMPSFSHLSGAKRKAIISFLKK
jgi:cytochrome c2